VCLDPLDDVLRGGPRREQLGHALFLEGDDVIVGNDPPPNTTVSVEPRFLRASSTAGNRVMWAPDIMDRPTISTASCTAAAAIMSGVWCSPV